MIQAYIKDTLKPSSKVSEVKWRFVGLEGYPSKDINYHTYFLNPYRLTQEKSKQSIKINTPQNHGLLAGEWMGAAVLGESPADQRLDDGLAVVFESEILQYELDVLGYPLLKVKLNSDKPKAMLFAQLSEVREDGFVQRVSYGVLNLALNKERSEFTPLIKDEWMQRELRLDCCGHRFAKGTKIRLSLATTFWPMLESVTLDLNECDFALPVFSDKDSNKVNLEAQSAPLTPLTLLKEGRVDRSINYDILSDTYTCITNGVGGVFGEGVYRFDEIDVLVEHNLKRELVLQNENPLSAKYTIIQKMKIGRENCMVYADIILTQTSDKEYFYIKGKMQVKENEKLVFNKNYNYKTLRKSL